MNTVTVPVIQYQCMLGTVEGLARLFLLLLLMCLSLCPDMFLLFSYNGSCRRSN